MATEVFNVNWEVDYEDGTKSGRQTSICFAPYFSEGCKKPFSELRVYFKENRVDDDVVPILRDVFKAFKVKGVISQDGPDYKGQWMIVYKPTYGTPIEGKVYTTMSRYLDESKFPQTLREYKKFRDQKVTPYKAMILAHAVTGAGNGHSLVYCIKPQEGLNMRKFFERMKEKKPAARVHFTLGGTENYFGAGKDELRLEQIKKKLGAKNDPSKVTLTYRKVKAKAKVKKEKAQAV